MDCTPRPRLPLRGLVAALAVISLGLAGLAPRARADGDPASDVLAQQSLFLPADAGLNAAGQAQLSALVQAAARSHYPVKVAVIASSTDLGSVTELWNQPQVYARFLGEELSLLAGGRLVVVMPAGVGVTTIGPNAGAEQQPPPAVAGLHSSAAAGLGTVAMTAVQRLAAAAGIHLSGASAAPPAGAPSASTPTPWIVFALGAGLIAAAWAVSLRARPPAWWRSGARAAEPPAAR